MIILYPEDRRGKEETLPPHQTLFDPKRHEPPRGVMAPLDDLTGWTAEADGVSGAFGVTPALALWGDVGAFVEIAPAPAPGTITLRPPTPIPIPEGADLFEVWVTGDVLDWQRRGGKFALHLMVCASGVIEEETVTMADFINWPTHGLRIVNIPKTLHRGGVVTGLRLSGHNPARMHRFGLDRLCAYRDVRKPLTLTPRPRRPLRCPPEQIVGLHTGPGQLPFPTRDETILPDNPCMEFTTHVKQEGDRFRFTYAGKDAEIAYLWTPRQDAFQVTVQIDGHDVGQALSSAALLDPGNRAWTLFGHTAVEVPPLPDEALHDIPTTLAWRGVRVPPLDLPEDAAGNPIMPVYDVARHGELPFYNFFRAITCDRPMDLQLELSAPQEHLTVWLNGNPVRAARRGDGFKLWNGTWALSLRPGKNILALCFIMWPGGSLEVKPFAAGARWAGAWRAFGPTPNVAARPPFPCLCPVRSVALSGNTATAIFEPGAFGPLTVHMRLWGKSLVVDCRCPSGAVSLFDPGCFRGLRNARVRSVPGMPSNAVLLADANDRTLFFSHLHDWYRSNASCWSSRFGSATGTDAVLQGPLTYAPKTDGTRNPLCERYFLTCSPVYEDVLPNIPNPPSPWAVEAGRYVFQESWGPLSFDKELAKAKRWVAYGMTNILHLHHEAGWGYQSPDATAAGYGWVYDGCTLRLDVAPRKGGNKAMQRFLAAEQALGLRAGLYTNYTDYYPLNPLFFSDRTILQPDGSRQTGWMQSYRMKPSLAVEYDAWFAPRIARRFHPDAAYTDVHTAIAPWDRVDYDARVPGAGTLAATYYADGELLLNDQRHYGGPVFSEGGRCHWMYAGLVSGNYGQIGIKSDDPPDPAFNLLKIHPLETDIGLSVGVGGWVAGTDDLEAQVDRYLLGVITYGHIAYLPEEPFDARLLLRVYHMSRAFSTRCAGLKPLGVHYQDEGGRWLTVSEAHARGLGDHCRLRVRYSGTMTLYANWSKALTWIVTGVSEGEMSLPPNGYLLDTPNGVLCSSVLIEGHRCDRAATPEGWYVDGRGREFHWGPLTARGSAALLIDPANPGRYRLIDGGGNETFRIDEPYAPTRYRAVSPAGQTLIRRTAKTDGTGAILAAVMTAVRYEWRIGTQKEQQRL